MGFFRDKRNSSNNTSPCADLRLAYHNCFNRLAYHNCFNRWYSEKFLKGHWGKEECVSEWEKYKDCLSKHLEDKNLSRFLETEGVNRIPAPVSK